MEGGSFLMGEKKFEHKVKLDSFLAGKYEVSTKEYIRFLNYKEINSKRNYKVNKLIDLSSFLSAVNYNKDQ
ncbi:formylglycine-generating enzyme family protein [Natroniella acetigena]|nr:formylglycine-generating enzyme family protein [Natroniella acetigena]